MARSEPSQAAAPKVELDEANRMFQRREATFVDVRSASDFERSHIPSALSVPLADLWRRVTEVPRDKPVILY